MPEPGEVVGARDKKENRNDHGGNMRTTVSGRYLCSHNVYVSKCRLVCPALFAGLRAALQNVVAAIDSEVWFVAGGATTARKGICSNSHRESELDRDVCLGRIKRRGDESFGDFRINEGKAPWGNSHR